jgi:predicted Ser/Thr protein kinase
MLQKDHVLKGRYLVLQKIGSGGHGTVFRARDKTKNRVVAIRVLSPDLVDDGDYIRHFHREAKLAALLDSPHIVKVLETDHVSVGNEHVHFQVMEYVDGPTLQRVLNHKGRLPTVKALAIAVQIARALEEAHDKGVLHHDIKPTNIFIAEDETAKVGDFGVARSVNVPTPRDDAALDAPTYMSPERCRRQEKQVDVRSDIYSLGVVVYQMLAGRPPFEEDSPATICHKHIHDTPPSMTASVPGLPVSVQKFVDRCLQKNPRKRFQTPLELRLALEGLMEAERTDQTTAEMPPPTVARVLRQRPLVERERLRSRMLYREAPAGRERGKRYRTGFGVATMAGILVALALALGVAGFVWSRSEDDLNGTPTPNGTRTISLGAPSEAVVAYIGEDGNLHVASESGEDIVKVTDDGGAIHPSWSPDGRRIAYVHVTGEDSSGVPTTELVVVNWDGSNAQILVEAGIYEFVGQQHTTVLRNPRWSPDGSAIYYLEDRGEHEAHLNRLMLDSDSVQPEVDLLDPAVLFGEGAYLESFDLHPGDGTIVYEGCRTEGPFGCGLGVQSPPGVAARTALLVPIQHGYFHSLPAWSLDGNQIGLYAYGAGAPRIMTIDTAGGDLKEQDYTESKPDEVENRFWPTLTPLPEGGFAYESSDEIQISSWGDSPSGTRIAGQHPAVFPGLGYQRTAAAWPGLANLDCGTWWKGEYFASDSPAGEPTMVRCDERIDFNWDDGSGPWIAMPPNGFSARWTRSVNFTEPGAYTLTTFTDDGVRLWFDGGKVIDEWHPQHEKHEKDVTLEGGEHTIRMEFYDEAGEAIARLSWDRVEPTPTPTPPKPSPTPTATQRPAATPTPSPVSPDLVITALRWDPARLAKGDAITRWCVTVANRGGDPTTSVAPLLVVKVDGIEKAGRSARAPGAGKSSTTCVSGVWEFGVGSHTAMAEIDVAKQVKESDEENNTFTKGIIVGPPR